MPDVAGQIARGREAQQEAAERAEQGRHQRDQKRVEQEAEPLEEAVVPIGDVARKRVEPDLGQRLADILADPRQPGQQPLEPEIADLGGGMEEDEEDRAKPTSWMRCRRRRRANSSSKRCDGAVEVWLGMGRHVQTASVSPAPTRVDYRPRRSLASWFRRSTAIW